MYMPEKRPLERAKRDQRAGKAPSTQAGEFVREEIDHVREGKHGAKNTKQAIAIGLSKARRAGVKLPPQGATAPAAPASNGSGNKAVSRRSLSQQAKTVAHKRSHADRSRAAKKAAQTRKRQRKSR